MRRAALAGVEPNPAHHALARLDREWPGELLLVTQNVDDLHDRAGSTRLVHMHGELKSALCPACGQRTAWESSLVDGHACPACNAAALRRSEEHTSELQSLMRISYAVFCLKKKNKYN